MYIQVESKESRINLKSSLNLDADILALTYATCRGWKISPMIGCSRYSTDYPDICVEPSTIECSFNVGL